MPANPTALPSFRWRETAYRLALVATALPFIFPLAWLALMSLQPASQIYSASQPLHALSPTLENFRNAWELLDLVSLFRNTLVVSIFSTLGCVISSSLAGFAFATMPYRASRLIFSLTLSTIILPASATLIPLFYLFSRLGWVNTFLPLVLPAALGNAFYIFLFRQNFRTLPTELFDCAELDGCNPLMTYFYIALPLSRPALVAVAAFEFLASWNDFLNPLIYLHSPELQTLSLGLATFQGFYFTQTHYLLPVSLLSILPLIIIFGFTQQYLLQGIASTGWNR